MENVFFLLAPFAVWIALEAFGFTLDLIMKKNTGEWATTWHKLLMTLLIMIPLIYFVEKAGL